MSIGIGISIGRGMAATGEEAGKHRHSRHKRGSRDTRISISICVGISIGIGISTGIGIAATGEEAETHA